MPDNGDHPLAALNRYWVMAIPILGCLYFGTAPLGAAEPLVVTDPEGVEERGDETNAADLPKVEPAGEDVAGTLDADSLDDLAEFSAPRIDWYMPIDGGLTPAVESVSSPGHSAATVGVREDDYDRDVPPATRHELLPNLFFGGEVSLQAEGEVNYDLDSRTDDDLVLFEPSTTIAFSYLPGRRTLFYVSVELNHEFELADASDFHDAVTELSLKRAYFRADDVVPGISVQVGRQNFKDEREWYFDETLDAVRLNYMRGEFELEVGVGRRRLIEADPFRDKRKDRINTYIATASHEVLKDIEVAGFAVFRDDRSERRGRPIFLGLRSQGDVKLFDHEISYWADVATVRGDMRGRDIEGYGFDVGVTVRPDLPFEPSLTVSTAFGSGDSNPNAGDDTEFRQTGLEDNAYKFGGVSRLKYYGEVFDPELRNLHVFTVAGGVRPTENSSIDLVYHHFRQDKVSDRLRGSSIELDPNEDPSHRSKTLGNEIDLVVGAKEVLPNLDIDFVFGYFFSGSAFRVETEPDVFEDADDAFFVGIEAEFSF